MSEIKLIEVRYIGRVKVRVDGSQTAFGYSNNTWSVAITKSALYAWFGLSTRPGEAVTLYNVLCVPQTATAEEIKKAYRRLALQWHPDKCKESDAAKQFHAIQHAYDILKSDKRSKYDAGLALQSSMKAVTNTTDDEFGYRSPLRCGYILGEGMQKSGKFVVEKILQWQDIVNATGKTLVVSWPPGADKHTEAWL